MPAQSGMVGLWVFLASAVIPALARYRTPSLVLIILTGFPLILSPFLISLK